MAVLGALLSAFALQLAVAGSALAYPPDATAATVWHSLGADSWSSSGGKINAVLSFGRNGARWYPNAGDTTTVNLQVQYSCDGGATFSVAGSQAAQTTNAGTSPVGLTMTEFLPSGGTNAPDNCYSNGAFTPSLVTAIRMKPLNDTGGALTSNTVAVHASGTVPTPEPTPTFAPGEGSDEDGCWFLSCIWNWIKNVPQMVMGWFTPSVATQDEWTAFRTDLTGRVPFAFVAQPIAWAKCAVHGQPCPDSEDGGQVISGAHALRFPDGGKGDGTTQVFVMANPGHDGQPNNDGMGGGDNPMGELVGSLRVVFGALLWGGALLGLAMWAFGKYAPGGSN